MNPPCHVSRRKNGKTTANTSKPPAIAWETVQKMTATGIVAMLTAVVARNRARQQVSLTKPHSRATTNGGVYPTP